MSSRHKIKRKQGKFYIKEAESKRHMNVKLSSTAGLLMNFFLLFLFCIQQGHLFSFFTPPFLLLCFLLSSLLPFRHLFENVISYPTLLCPGWTPRTSDSSSGRKQTSDCYRLHGEKYIHRLFS